MHLLSRAWGVPRSTLQRRISGKVTGSEHASGRKPYFPEEAERELAATLKTLAQRGFPFTKRDVQQVAFHFADKNNISGFSKTAGRAGYYWFQNFLKRNPELGMRKPEVLSAARLLDSTKRWLASGLTSMRAFWSSWVLRAHCHIYGTVTSLGFRTSSVRQRSLDRLASHVWRCVQERRGRQRLVWQRSMQKAHTVER